MTGSKVDIEQALRAELAPGERLLWSGQPRQGIALRPADTFMIPFSLMWGGFAIFWEYSVVTGGSPDFMKLWGIPFVIMGLYLIVGRFFADARLRARTYYGLTDQRALIVSGLFSRNVRSVELRTVQEINLRESGDRTGSIIFGAPPFGASMATPSWPGMSGRLAPAFDMIPDARSVYNQVRSAQSSLLPAG